MLPPVVNSIALLSTVVNCYILFIFFSVAKYEGFTFPEYVPANWEKVMPANMWAYVQDGLKLRWTAGRSRVMFLINGLQRIREQKYCMIHV